MPNVGRACVANVTTTVTVGGGNATFTGAKWDKTTIKYTSWWCSNGLYKKAFTGDAGTVNVIQAFRHSDNPRRELA